MTILDWPTVEIDPYDATQVAGVDGLLGEFNRAGVLIAADVHVATTVGRLGGDDDELVLLAVALTVRGLRRGSVCIDLADQHRIASVIEWPEPQAWLRRVQASPLAIGAGPLRVDLGLVYLDRYWQEEIQVAADLVARVSQLPPQCDQSRLAAALNRLFPKPNGQRRAAQAAATGWLTVLGGGPGTGKTHTVARLLAVLLDQPGPRPRVALAAPTGKAAARLQESVLEERSKLTPADQERLAGVTASTIHRLLGRDLTRDIGRNSRFKHHRGNRLPFDVVVIDETSMVSLTLMARLLEALRPESRLILVGDPDQLASVEAGVVLADVVAGLTGSASTAIGAPVEPGPVAVAADRWSVPGPTAGPGVVLLTTVWRFSGGIRDLAAAVRDGAADTAVELLRAGSDQLSFDEVGLQDDVLEAAAALRSAAEAGDGRAALAALTRHRVLCAHRTGPFGVEEWTGRIERWLAEVRGTRWEGEWYLGRPLMVTENDYLLNLFNGDAGVIVAGGGDPAQRRAVFARGADLVTFSPSRLARVQTVHAMTVHRSQGSQFDAVSLILPEDDSPLLSRELLYTALTRAQLRVRVVGTESALRTAIERRAARASGLRERLTRR